MIENETFQLPGIRDLAIANHIAHGGEAGYAIGFYCENCHGGIFHILEMREKIGNRNQDVIIEKTFFLQCQRCGSEQMEHTLTIVPSWSGPNINREKLPVWEGEE